MATPIDGLEEAFLAFGVPQELLFDQMNAVLRAILSPTAGRASTTRISVSIDGSGFVECGKDVVLPGIAGLKHEDTTTRQHEDTAARRPRRHDDTKARRQDD